jgi:hypothetical protein
VKPWFTWLTTHDLLDSLSVAHTRALTHTHALRIIPCVHSTLVACLTWAACLEEMQETMVRKEHVFAPQLAVPGCLLCLLITLSMSLCVRSFYNVVNLSSHDLPFLFAVVQMSQTWSTSELLAPGLRAFLCISGVQVAFVCLCVECDVC